MKKILFLVFILLFCAHTLIFAQADTTKPYKSVTHHTITINGKPISYTAIAGSLQLKNKKDSVVALIGYVAYFKDGETDAAKRPLTFAYNGGPGSSSLWLHMGALGPKRVVVNDPENNPPPPYKVVDNDQSIIDVTDLVMIDPVGTGISHAINNAKNTDFWGVDEDIESLSFFVKQFITDNDRWNSPKYLLGESYGTMRSAGIADYLQTNLGIALNGVMLVSSVLDLRSLIFEDGDDLSYILHLPTYAAVAWYHNRIADKSKGLEAFLNDARNFAGGEYAAALMKGNSLTDAEKENVLNKLSLYTGLSKAYLSKANLRVNEPRFTAELLRDSSEQVGRIDARYKGINQDLLSEYASDDPQGTQIEPAFTAAFMNYYYGDLKVDKKIVYHISAYGADGFRWNWKHNSTGFGDNVPPNTGVDLADAMSKNPNLKVMVLNGYYDLATPFYATEYTFNHLGLEKKIQQNITMKYYEAGHMMYIHQPSLEKFKKDIADFIAGTINK